MGPAVPGPTSPHPFRLLLECVILSQLVLSHSVWRPLQETPWLPRGWTRGSSGRGSIRTVCFLSPSFVNYPPKNALFTGHKDHVWFILEPPGPSTGPAPCGRRSPSCFIRAVSSAGSMSTYSLAAATTLPFLPLASQAGALLVLLPLLRAPRRLHFPTCH